MISEFEKRDISSMTTSNEKQMHLLRDVHSASRRKPRPSSCKAPMLQSSFESTAKVLENALKIANLHIFQILTRRKDNIVPHL